MNTLSFEADNDNFRVMDNSQLVYTLTNSEKLMHRVKQSNVMEETISLVDILDQLTPARKKVALAAIELYKRSKTKDVQTIKSSRDIFSIMSPYINDLTIEEFWAIYVNTSLKIMRKVRISCGGIDATHVDVRVVMKYALQYNATSFFVCHNHPSGKVKPSRVDDRLTEQLKKAGELMNVKLADHVIIGGDGYYSYCEEGRI